MSSPRRRDTTCTTYVMAGPVREWRIRNHPTTSGCSSSGRREIRMKHGRPRGLSRRDFLKVGGAGLAGAAFLGAAGCGGEEQGGGATEIYFTSAPDASGTTEK